MGNNKDIIDPFEFFEEPRKFIPVDDWVPSEEDMILKTVKGAVMLNVSEFYGVDPNPSFDAFILKNKRAYNNAKVRLHLVHYINYLEKYYDTDHELIMIYYKLKYLIDYEKGYTKEAFFYDLEKYIMRGTISIKVGYMNRDNYSLNLTYKNKRNPALQYNDRHGMILMKLSLLMNCMIPLLCHFMYARSIFTTQDFLLEAYDILFHLYPDVDIYNKLYETAISNVDRNAEKNSLLWAVQDIRGINTTTHAIDCVTNIMINIVPKYLYNSNHIHFNFKSINIMVALCRNVYRKTPLIAGTL